MRPHERQLKIIDLVRREGRVSVERLVTEFGSSAETIRRDLSRLSLKGEIKKTHGGATLPAIHGEGPFRQRMGENVAAKRHIAQLAHQLVAPGDSLFIDTGTTTLIFAEELSNINNLTVVTNSLDIAKVLGKPDTQSPETRSKVYLLGGEYQAENNQNLGPMATAQLAHFQLNWAFIAVGGINSRFGVVDFDRDEVAITQQMIDRANRSVLLADSSKFGQAAPLVIAELARFGHLFCEQAPDSDLRQALTDSKVKVIY